MKCSEAPEKQEETDWSGSSRISKGQIAYRRLAKTRLSNDRGKDPFCLSSTNNSLCAPNQKEPNKFNRSRSLPDLTSRASAAFTRLTMNPSRSGRRTWIDSALFRRNCHPDATTAMISHCLVFRGVHDGSERDLDDEGNERAQTRSRQGCVAMLGSARHPTFRH